jgi:hypothetical protein
MPTPLDRIEQALTVVVRPIVRGIFAPFRWCFKASEKEYLRIVERAVRIARTRIELFKALPSIDETTRRNELGRLIRCEAQISLLWARESRANEYFEKSFSTVPMLYFSWFLCWYSGAWNFPFLTTATLSALARLLWSYARQSFRFYTIWIVVHQVSYLAAAWTVRLGTLGTILQFWYFFAVFSCAFALYNILKGFGDADDPPWYLVIAASSLGQYVVWNSGLILGGIFWMVCAKSGCGQSRDRRIACGLCGRDAGKPAICR